MDKWKNLLYKQVKLREYLKRKGRLDTAFEKDPDLFDDICAEMTRLGYDVPKLIKQYKTRLN